MKNMQVRIRRVPDGLPTPDAFELVEAPRPAIGPGQILCRARWLSLDPALRLQTGRVLAARAVAEVVESRNDVFTEGECVELEHGLQLLHVSDGSHAHRLRPGQNPPSIALGALGRPGMTAYFGLLDVARLQPRETVLVSDVAGAAGAMAGQIAMLHGARAIGIAGSKAACDWAVKSARFSACINYRADKLSERLRALVPNGADIYFDSTGGELLRTIVGGKHLAPHGRVVSCVDPPPRANGAAVLPVNVDQYEQRRDEFLKEAIPWFGEGLLVHREDVADGLHNAPVQLCRALRGETFGKPLVKV